MFIAFAVEICVKSKEYISNKKLHSSILPVELVLLFEIERAMSVQLENPHSPALQRGEGRRLYDSHLDLIAGSYPEIFLRLL